jgi:hypothetical protein
MQTELQMKPAGHETDFVGTWKLRREAIVADPACERIEWLISNHLVQLTADPSGWDELYRDPEDGRLWELAWPQSEMHGGGPPRLTCLTIDAARSKYGAVVDR